MNLSKMSTAGAVVSFLVMTGSVFAATTGTYTLAWTGERTSDTESVYIRGVGAGAFSPEQWTTAPPHLVADIRHPLLEARAGKFRNIYAPSAVANPGGGWYVYYGAWDGIDEGRDAIYATTTTDFISFGKRQTIIAPGTFQHVCNVNGQIDPTGSGVTLMCTAYPDLNQRNKPALFKLENPVPAIPLVASHQDIININGYSDYSNADINGMNVFLRDGGRNLLYFGDFKKFGNVHVAAGDDTTTSTFAYQGVALAEPLAVNDVKRLRDPQGGIWYLMGLHMNRSSLYYSLSRDPVKFPKAEVLLNSTGDADKYMVALGWVTNGTATDDGNRLLGVLYGAGADPALNQNRIFAQWFQKRVTFAASTGSSEQPEAVGAMGPSTGVFKMPASTWAGDISVGDAAGQPGELITSVTLEAGHVYELRRLTSAAAALRSRRGQHKTSAAHDPLNCDCLEVMPWERRGAQSPSSKAAIAY